MDLRTIWSKMLKLLESSVAQATFEAYIKPMTPHSFENDVFYLKTPDDFHKPTIVKRYMYYIKDSLSTVMGNNGLDVRIISPEDLTESGPNRRKHDNYTKTNLRHHYVFESFVEGKCNQLAFAAAQAVAETLGTTGYNPLFLYGGVGLGKTHLLHSIGNQVVEQNPDLKVRYISSETFTNEFVTAIREQTALQFKFKYRDCDLFLIDDVQFLEGKDGTQEEMFHTFNDIYSNNKQIVITSDLPPNKLTGLEERLTSRFAMGLQVDITMPDYETRAAILEKKLHREQIDIPVQVKEFILRNVVSNIRDLEGALNKITAYARLSKVPISLDLAETALKDQLKGHIPPVITVPYIQKIVSAHFKLTPEELNSRRRTQKIVFPRQIAMYLCRKLLEVSLPDVGNFFGGFDHTTVIHSCDKIANELEYDEKLRETVAELERTIKGE
ncbi:MAG: chromosomal replication initiator protein DnaA [Defluviitaleaceae bacterium]|nr:chromosomal replication initiator protein DnaA [Defluviitaleaceae bacterium]MCL2239763.1 chromosomal replication initiator protein DnaA [Defluviitaleaceae bacterium]